MKQGKQRQWCKQGETSVVEAREATSVVEARGNIGGNHQMAALRLLLSIETGIRYEICGSHCSILAHISIGKEAPFAGFLPLPHFFFLGSTASSTMAAVGNTKALFLG